MDARVVEIIALLIIFCCAVEGYTKGLLMKVYSLVRFVLMLVITIILVPIILPIIPVGVEGSVGIAFVLALIVSAIALGIVAAVLKIVDHIPVVNEVNKLGGAVLGMALGVIIVWILLFGVAAFQNIEWCRMVSGCVKESRILLMLEKYNPLLHIMEQFY